MEPDREPLARPLGFVRCPAGELRREHGADRAHGVIRARAFGLLAAGCALAWVPTHELAAATLPPIVAAAKGAQRDTVTQLIKRGENVNAAETDGTTALHWAVRAADAALVKQLLAA